MEGNQIQAGHTACAAAAPPPSCPGSYPSSPITLATWFHGLGHLAAPRLQCCGSSFPICTPCVVTYSDPNLNRKHERGGDSKYTLLPHPPPPPLSPLTCKSTPLRLGPHQLQLHLQSAHGRQLPLPHHKHDLSCSSNIQHGNVEVPCGAGRSVWRIAQSKPPQYILQCMTAMPAAFIAAPPHIANEASKLRLLPPTGSCALGGCRDQGGDSLRPPFWQCGACQRKCGDACEVTGGGNSGKVLGCAAQGGKAHVHGGT